MKPTLLTKSYNDLESNFRTYSRTIMQFATSLHRSRELRNFFGDASQFCEMCRSNGWTSKELRLFLDSYVKCALDLDVLRDAELRNTWDRFMKVFVECILIMYG